MIQEKGISSPRQDNLSRTRRCHQTEVQTPRSIHSPDRPHPPPGGAIFQAVNALHSLSPGDVRQTRCARAPTVACLEQPAILVFRPSLDDVDFVTRHRLLEVLIDLPEHVSTRHLVLPYPDRWPHFLLRETTVAHDDDLVCLWKYRGRIG